MKQAAILSAGCLISSKLVLFSNKKYIIYASNLSIYVLNSQHFALEKVVAVTERTLLSISVNPQDNNLIIATGLDGSISLWKINEEECVCKVNLTITDSNSPSRPIVYTSKTILVAWNPHNIGHCSFVTIVDNSMRIMDWCVCHHIKLEIIINISSTFLCISISLSYFYCDTFLFFCRDTEKGKNGLTEVMCTKNLKMKPNVIR